MTAHPSFLQLDRFLLGVNDATTSAHLKTCDECRAHVGRCEMPAPVPAELRDRAMRSARMSQLRRWLFGLSLAAAMVAIAGLGIRHVPGADVISAKGSPSVAIYVKRGAAVSLWDGHKPLFPGDAIQLKVAPAGFSRLTVASIAPSSVVELYSSAIDAQRETTLPRSWTVDADPRPEVMLIVFSRAPLSSADLRGARDELPRTAQVWATRVELWKQGGQR